MTNALFYENHTRRGKRRGGVRHDTTLAEPGRTPRSAGPQSRTLCKNGRGRVGVASTIQTNIMPK